VYPKPPGGWSAASATTAGFYPESTANLFRGLAVGPGVIALGLHDEIDGTSDVAVFTPGPAGFTGASGPAAHLEVSTGTEVVAASSSIVLTHVPADYGTAPTPQILQVFTEPSGGWSGTVAPAAQLQASDGAGLGYASMSDGTVAAVGMANIDRSTPTALYIFSEPAGGWSGVIHETARIPLTDIESLSLAGDTLVAIGGGQTKTLGAVAQAPVFVAAPPRRRLGGAEAAAAERLRPGAGCSRQ
jgi:hypothetical protein